MFIELAQVLREWHRAPYTEQFLVRTRLDVGGRAGRKGGAVELFPHS